MIQLKSGVAHWLDTRTDLRIKFPNVQDARPGPSANRALGGARFERAFWDTGIKHEDPEHA
jgi:hypothetical protein